MTLERWMALMLGSALLAGCPAATTGDDDDDDSAADDDDAADDAPALSGWFEDAWGSFHSVDETEWVTVSDFGNSTYAVAGWDNEAGWIVAQNGADNAWNAGLWSRFDYVEDGDGGHYFCQAAFDAASQADAEAAPASDATDPTAGGCGTFPWTQMSASIGPVPIRGVYVDNWGSFHDVDEASWVMGAWPDTSTFHISQYAPEEGWLVAENDAGNEYSPGAWSRFDWFIDDAGDRWFCQTAFDAADEDAAAATPAADPADPANGGCGTFPWSSLTADQGPLDILGDYTDEYATDHEVRQDVWTADANIYNLTQYSNAEQWVVAQNDSTHGWAPDLWSRFDWTWDFDGNLWLCQTAFDAADEAAALATPASDASDPAIGGCGGMFPWTNLTP
jgi:hypothetical protein